MKTCMHVGCNKQIQKQYDLCYYHYQEMIDNGKPDRWDCDWCREYKETRKDLSISDLVRMEQESGQ